MAIHPDAAINWAVLMLRVMIVDDEKPARKNLRALIERLPEARVVAEASGGREAQRLLAGTEVDVILLDIQMPGSSGMELARSLDVQARPVIIFVTAHSEFALEAFGVAATDYLLKPVSSERLAGALARVTARLGERSPGGVFKRLVVKSPNGFLFIPVTAIDWIEGSGNYLRLWIGGRYHLYRGTLAGTSARLPDQFLRIHRSALVNTDRVAEVVPLSGGNHQVVLSNGRRLTLARRQREALEALLKRNP